MYLLCRRRKITILHGLKAYNDAMDAYNEKQEYYNKYIEPSAILSAIAGFDKLVNGIVTSLNDILCPEKTIETTKELTDNDGNVLQADEYIYNASVNATLYDRYGKEVKGVMELTVIHQVRSFMLTRQEQQLRILII